MPANITSMPANLKKEELKQVSKAVAKKLAVNIVLGVVATVAVTLISGAILSTVQPAEGSATE